MFWGSWFLLAPPGSPWLFPWPPSAPPPPSALHSVSFKLNPYRPSMRELLIIRLGSCFFRGSQCDKGQAAETRARHEAEKQRGGKTKKHKKNRKKQKKTKDKKGDGSSVGFFGNAAPSDDQGISSEAATWEGPTTGAGTCECATCEGPASNQRSAATS